MKRGRKPKPKSVKQASGNPGRRPLNHDEPAATAGAPLKPEDLAGDAAREWDVVCSHLANMNLLAGQDGAAIRLYCEAYARYLEAGRALAKYGMVFLTKDSKYPVQSPYLAIQTTAIKQMQTFFSEFGFSPSSRTRIKAPPKQTSDPLSDFLAQDASPQDD